jgi:hypothetical protein
VDVVLPETAESVWKLSYAGGWIVARGYKGPAWLLHVDDGTWYRFETSWMASAGEEVEMAISVDGRELLAFDDVGRRLYRYGLPAD